MGKIERGTIKFLIIEIIAVAICGIILYPILDLIYCKLITNSEFSYSVHNHIISPIIFACIFGVISLIIDKIKLF